MSIDSLLDAAIIMKSREKLQIQTIHDDTRSTNVAIKQSSLTHLEYLINNLEIRLHTLEQQQNQSNSTSLTSSASEDGPIASPIPPHTPVTPPKRYTPVTNQFTDVSQCRMPEWVVALRRKSKSTPRRRLPQISPGNITYAQAVATTPAPAETSNKYAPLHYDIPDVPDVAELTDEEITPIIHSLQTANVKSVNRRPNMCETEKYVQNMTQQPLYTATTDYKQELTSIVSDSMTRSIKVNYFNSHLDMRKECVKISKFPAAHARQIRLYSQYTLQVDRPTHLIIVAGTNDVAYDMSSGSAKPEEIAGLILNIARDAKEEGVKDIFISGLMGRRGLQFYDIISEINIILRLNCIREDFIFINNDNILLHDLSDGLHLNQKGNTKFINNLLQCCHSYNPYLNADDL